MTEVVHNWALETKSTAWTERKESLSAYGLTKMLTAKKKEPGMEFLSDVNSQSLQRGVFNSETAYTNFFKGLAEFPRYRSKRGRQSFHGELRSITVSRTAAGKYYAACLCEDGKELPTKKKIKAGTTLGIDLGLTHFAVFSDGRKVDNSRHLKLAQRSLKHRQRVLARRVKGSAKREKARLKVALAHEKVTNRRKDFLHKLTTGLVNESQVDTFCIEDLAVQNMQKNRRLAFGISDAGWREFRRQLTYKAAWCGKNVLVIGRFEPSTKRCSSCGTIRQGLTLADRVWTCACGAHHDRDVNAALNVKQMALLSVA